MTAYRAIVLEHFRRPRNRGPLPDANAEAEGANPLCGDRVRIRLRVDAGVIADARFSADACILCIASASVLTEHLKGLSLAEAAVVDAAWVHEALEGTPPPARLRCTELPVDTTRRAVGAFRESSPESPNRPSRPGFP